MKAVRRIDTKEVVSMKDDGGDGALTPGPGEELFDLPDLSMEELNRRARRAAGGNEVGRTVLRDDGSIHAEPAQARSRTPMVDRITESRRSRGARLDGPITMEELAEAERSISG